MSEARKATLFQPAKNLCTSDNLQILLGYLGPEDQFKLIELDPAIEAKAKTYSQTAFPEVKAELEEAARRAAALPVKTPIGNKEIQRALLSSQVNLANEEKRNKLIRKSKYIIFCTSLVGASMFTAGVILGDDYAALTGISTVFQFPLLIALLETCKNKLCIERTDAANNARLVGLLSRFSRMFRAAPAVTVQQDEPNPNEEQEHSRSLENV